MTKLYHFKRDNPTVLTWLNIFANSKERRTHNALYNYVFLQQSI